MFAGLVVNGEKVVTPFEESSSPSQINAAKGSSVRLYWSYSYIGDGPHDGIIKSRYKEQVIGFNSTSQPSIQALAKRSRQNGALKLESPVPAPFSGRAEVISSNSTLVIHNLQYNDSAYQFSSTVKVDIDPGDLARTNEVCLKPIVSLIVTGKKTEPRLIHLTAIINHFIFSHNYCIIYFYMKVRIRMNDLSFKHILV